MWFCNKVWYHVLPGMTSHSLCILRCIIIYWIVAFYFILYGTVPHRIVLCHQEIDCIVSLWNAWRQFFLLFPQRDTTQVLGVQFNFGHDAFLIQDTGFIRAHVWYIEVVLAEMTSVWLQAQDFPLLALGNLYAGTASVTAGWDRKADCHTYFRNATILVAAGKLDTTSEQRLIKKLWNAPGCNLR